MFARFARKENIKDGELLDIIDQLEKGQADADLGGDVYKVRLARSGKGKSSGYRVVVFFRRGNRTFFQYAFPKSFRDNITEKELRFFKKLAKSYLSLTEEQLTEAIKAGEFIEIKETGYGKEI